MSKLSKIVFIVLISATKLMAQEPVLVTKLKLDASLAPSDTVVEFLDNGRIEQIKGIAKSSIPFKVFVKGFKSAQLSESDQRSLAVLALSHSERLKRIVKSLGVTRVFEPTSVSISVTPEPARKDGVTRIQVSFNIKAKGSWYAVSIEGRPEIWRVEEGYIFLEEEGGVIKIKI